MFVWRLILSGLPFLASFRGFANLIFVDIVILFTSFQPHNTVRTIKGIVKIVFLIWWAHMCRHWYKSLYGFNKTRYKIKKYNIKKHNIKHTHEYIQETINSTWFELNKKLLWSKMIYSFHWNLLFIFEMFSRTQFCCEQIEHLNSWKNNTWYVGFWWFCCYFIFRTFFHQSIAHHLCFHLRLKWNLTFYKLKTICKKKKSHKHQQKTPDINTLSISTTAGA